ncbi:hypothetical protein A2229_03455 [Candidatus Peregrinibacteria bacterium RIFOXYA2_FULL_33_7]|nr:MAG: hypothetical protein A2229_03455 [Candidatus Peregrinibacteria bacterium RIFOXYA2_FULL_33_7]
MRSGFRKKSSKRRIYKKISLIALGFIVIIFIYFYVALGELNIFVKKYYKISGFPFSERNYLILLQNNSELRPTGGFISAYGIITFKSGFLTNVEIHDSYDQINKISSPAPYPLSELLSGPTYPGHGFRDANFNPDFFSSIIDLQYFFSRAYPEVKLDGVFAIDLKFIENILKMTGPIQAESDLFTGENIFTKLEQQVSDIDLHNIDAINSRKDILKRFAGALMKKASFKLTRPSKIKEVVINNLDQKHILLFFFDPKINDFIVKNNWNGALKNKGGDFVGVIEANLGGMKSDRYIKRSINYEIDLNNQNANQEYSQIDASLKITIEHGGAQNTPLSGWYQGWIRPFIPEGAQIKSLQIHDQNFQIVNFIDDKSKLLKINHFDQVNNLVAPGIRINMNPGEKRIISLKYSLPSRILANNTYKLCLRKQPGTDLDYYSVIIKAPLESSMTSEEFEVKEDRAFFSGFLKTDKSLQLQIYPDKSPPRIIQQNIPELNHIKVTFNEPINQNSAYYIEIFDTDLKNPNLKEQIIFEKYYFSDPRTLDIITSGMNNQKEEHYIIKLYGINDLNGNLTSENPRQITAVYRYGL